MAAGLIVLVIMVLSPGVVLGVHIVLSRAVGALRPGVSSQLVCILSVVAANAPVLALVWLAPCLAGAAECPTGAASNLLYAVIVHNALGYSYFHFFNMSETARRIRILHDLNLKPSMDLSEFTGYYDTGENLGVRLDRLVRMGSLRMVDGRYVTSKKMLLYAARAIALWGRVINTPMGG